MQSSDMATQAIRNSHGFPSSNKPCYLVCPAGGCTYKLALEMPGDTHGQLEDVLTIFLAHGTPSSRNRPALALLWTSCQKQKYVKQGSEEVKYS